MEIAGNVFIITGASSGIGEATAKAITALGGKVALLARSAEALEALAKTLPDSLPVTVDVTDFKALRSAVNKVYNHYGKVNGLVNNAGRSYAATIEEIVPELFDEIFHLNVLAPIVAMQAVIPIMRKSGAGSIVSVNSGTAFMYIPTYSVYSSSKRALMGFTQTARAELAEDDIVVSEVYPGITATNFGKNRLTGAGSRGPTADYASGDSAEYVADIIVRAIQEGGDQYFANDHIKRLAGK
jgi:short-subunit dehydrogenase